ncbi:bifunctional peptidase and arginyl-hydroxylase JMJD5-like isoform X1 [Ptychodera flava]|uniref:bifunctional peptidase and arginyl-hydroxylase JMJD5-like isoform X1 n=1 Tax=Ptychodera flava TaxID=63121 RepID=UPI00396A057F
MIPSSCSYLDITELLVNRSVANACNHGGGGRTSTASVHRATTFKGMNVLPGRLRSVAPSTANDLKLQTLEFDEKLHSAISFKLQGCIDAYFNGNTRGCLKLTEEILSYTWEKLNTGHWKDVHIAWRQLYSLASLLKALSLCVECVCLNEDASAANDDCMYKAAIKACDMGLLMGAPVLDNILSRLATAIHHQQSDAGTGEREVSKVDKEEVSPRKRRRLDNRIPDIDKNKEIIRTVNPSLEHFRSAYMQSKTPVVIHKGMDHWPAMTTRRWSIEYLHRVAGSRTVPIEIGARYTDENWSQSLMTVSEFISKYIDREETDSKDVGYLAQHQLFDQIPELKRDICVPDYCCLSDSDDDDDVDDVDINAWFGPRGTVSPLHHDPKHNCLAQVVGSKYIRLYSEEDSASVYPHEGHLLNNTSEVDVEHPDFEKYPLFATAPYLECILNPGEMLYIPPKCWHYVRSLDVSFSVSFWWS